MVLVYDNQSFKIGSKTGGVLNGVHYLKNARSVFLYLNN